MKAADALAALRAAREQRAATAATATAGHAAHASGTHSVGRVALGIGLGIFAGLMSPVIKKKGGGTSGVQCNRLAGCRTAGAPAD